MPWFKRSDGVLFKILDDYPDLIERLRSEGWKEVADPAAAPEPVSEPSRAVVPAQDEATPLASERAALPQDHTQDDTQESAVSKPVQAAKPPPIRATAKVGGRKPGTGKLSPQFRAAQIPKKTR